MNILFGHFSLFRQPQYFLLFNVARPGIKKMHMLVKDKENKNMQTFQYAITTLSLTASCKVYNRKKKQFKKNSSSKCISFFSSLRLKTKEQEKTTHFLRMIFSNFFLLVISLLKCSRRWTVKYFSDNILLRNARSSCWERDNVYIHVC